MEGPEHSSPNPKSSALPRFSKLPQARATRPASSSDASQASTDAATSSPAPRSNRYSLIPPPSSVAATLAAIESKASKASTSTRYGQPSRDSHYSQHSVETNSHDAPSRETMEERYQATSQTLPSRKQKPGPSPEHMLESTTLPSNASPNRRRSGLFMGHSSIRPPSRAGSALDHTRPLSQSALTYSAIRPASPTRRPLSPTRIRPPSPTKSFAMGAKASSNMPNSGVIRAPVRGRRAVSSYLSKYDAKAPHDSEPSLKSIAPHTLRPSPMPMTAGDDMRVRRTTPGNQTMAIRPASQKSPIKVLFPSQLPGKPSRGNSITGLRKPGQIDGAGAGLTGPMKRPGNAMARPTSQQLGELPSSPEESSAKPLKGLEATEKLRDVIAKQKAAAKKSASLNRSSFTPRSVINDTVVSPDIDAGSFDMLDSTSINILRKRITTARTEGRLNISALCLTRIPKEVLTMYESDGSSSAWYENVDLKRLNAADNEISEIGADVFPDFDPSLEESPMNIFLELEALDLHGNQLEELPVGLRWLRQLASLNLSRNQLTTEAFDVLAGTALKELRLSKNSIQGVLPAAIGDMHNLEVLDLSENSITQIPAEMRRLAKLRFLNVAENRLTALPFQELADLPLAELLAPKNRLGGSLLPPEVKNLPNLQILDISHNSLVSVADGEIEMPALKTVSVANNRIAALPSLVGWPQLVVLNAEENKISEIPDGFTSLQALKSADFSSNSLLAIDDRIGTMDNLNVLRIEDNPLRERKFLKLNTEDLKIELRSRHVSPTLPAGSDGGIRPFRLLGGEVKSQAPAWTVQAGVLDRSSTKLRAFEVSDMERIREEEVRTFLAHRNQIQQITSPIEILGATLATLDLSHNKLSKSESFISEAISLPHLQTLNLTSNSLTSLEPLVSKLDAPALATVILPFNRLTSLPHLTRSFPALSTFLASNNAITHFDVECIRGVRVLDLGSNEIEHLPPQLALLQGQLRTLMVGGNKFRVPGWGVLEKGTDAILEWCRKKIPEPEL